MTLRPVWDLFRERIFDAASSAELFNMYRDRRDDLDHPEGPARRRENLQNYLECFPRRPPLFLLAEAPGPWGCRFSGVPLTAESQLDDPAFPIDGTPTSREDVPHKEYSANIFWRVLQPVFPQFFVWNSVPLHPHDPGEPLSIRNPRRAEVRAWHPLLTDLLDELEPECIVGIGRKAERALQEIGAAVTYVRHPSQGGATKFETGIREIVRDLGVQDLEE